MGDPWGSLHESLTKDIAEDALRVKQSFGRSDQLAVIELVRALNHHFLGRFYGLRKARKLIDKPEQLTWYGANKALSLFLTAACSGPSVSWTGSSADSQDWADSCLQHCGRLSLFEQAMEYCRYELATLVEAGDGSLEFRLAGFPIGMEALDAKEFRWMARIAEMAEEPLQQVFRPAEHHVRKLMSDRVAPWRGHFIQYESHPYIDQYYHELGMSLSRTFTGQDSFSGETRFGGKEFNLYRGAIGLFIGFSLKHIGFSIELLKKSPNLEARNVLTHFARVDELATAIGAELEVGEEEAREVISVITLAPENLPVHCSPAGCATPSLIKIGDDHVVRPHWGLLTNPFHFMLRELRQRYRADWDRALDEREGIFRRDVYHLFPSPHIKKIERCIPIRLNGRDLTDVDAALFDQRTGALALIQLKWQDTFVSMRELSSRKRNYLREGNKWVDEVSKWVAGLGPKAIGRLSGLEPDEAASVSEICLFVIGRNHGHFSGPEEPDSRAAWAVWPQVMRLRLEQAISRDPIRQLNARLREDSPRRRPPTQIEGGEIIIRGRKIRFPTIVGDEDVEHPIAGI